MSRFHCVCKNIADVFCVAFVWNIVLNRTVFENFVKRMVLLEILMCNFA